MKITEEMVHEGAKALFALDNQGADLDDVAGKIGFGRFLTAGYEEKAEAVLRAAIPTNVLPGMVVKVKPSPWGGWEYNLYAPSGQLIVTGTGPRTKAEAEDRVEYHAKRWIEEQESNGG